MSAPNPLRTLTCFRAPSRVAGRDTEDRIDLVCGDSSDVRGLLFRDAPVWPTDELSGLGLPLHGSLGRQRACMAAICRRTLRLAHQAIASLRRAPVLAT